MWVIWHTRYQQLEYSYHVHLLLHSITTTQYSITFKHCHQITEKLLCMFEILSVYSIWSWHDFASLLWRLFILHVRCYSIFELDFQLKQLLFNRICIWKFYYTTMDLKNVYNIVMYNIGYRFVWMSVIFFESRNFTLTMVSEWLKHVRLLI
jgi:hypothetical protein